MWHEWKWWTEVCAPHKQVKCLHSWVYRDNVLVTTLLTGGLFLVVKLICVENCFFTSRLHCANLRATLVMSLVLLTLRLHLLLFLGLSLRCLAIIFFLWWGLLALRKMFSFPCLNLGLTPVDIGWFSVASPLCFWFCSGKKKKSHVLRKSYPVHNFQGA